jgi:hypothetical protein
MNRARTRESRERVAPASTLLYGGPGGGASARRPFLDLPGGHFCEGRGQRVVAGGARKERFQEHLAEMLELGAPHRGWPWSHNRWPQVL